MTGHAPVYHSGVHSLLIGAVIRRVYSHLVPVVRHLAPTHDHGVIAGAKVGAQAIFPVNTRRAVRHSVTVGRSAIRVIACVVKLSLIHI